MKTLPVCLVTGAGKDRVGATVAKFAAKKGYRVAVHYNSSQAQALELVTLLQRTGAEAAAFCADIRSEVAVSKMVSAVRERFGRIDLVVNCAATWLSKPLAETSADDVLAEFSTNVLGTFLVSKIAGLMMTENSTGGHIIVIGDWAVERPYRNYSAYMISKGCLSTLTRVLAVELGEINPNVRVNCLAPGPVLAPDNASESDTVEMAESTLVKKVGGAESIAQAVFALTENEFITGVVLNVDGEGVFMRVGREGMTACKQQTPPFILNGGPSR